MEHGREGKEGDSALPPFILRIFSLRDDVREGDQEASCNITQSACSEAITAFSEEDLCGQHIAGAAPPPPFPVVSAASPLDIPLDNFGPFAVPLAVVIIVARDQLDQCGGVILRV